MAARFIEALTGGEEIEVTFQTFTEGGASQIPPRILHGRLGSLWEQLDHSNANGHGVFAMVNAGDGRGRAAQNVVALRALFTDDDGGHSAPIPSTRDRSFTRS